MTDIILSHSEIIFEGLQRPSAMLMFRDGNGKDGYSRSDSNTDEDNTILERYFVDVQNLFLKKFALFAGGDEISETESHKLRSLLEEMIKVKSLTGKIVDKGN